MHVKFYGNYDIVETLRDKSYPHYFCLLTAPRKTQDDLAFIWGIAAEIRFIPIVVTDPLAGLMRLTAWRDRLLAWQRDDLIDWLNSYEVFFDNSLDIRQYWLEYTKGETLLMQHCLLLLQKEPPAEVREAARKLGQTMGLIYILQSNHNLGFTVDPHLKNEMLTTIEANLASLCQIKKIPKAYYSLFALIGYCQIWLKHYKKASQPVTITELRISLAILKQKFKFFWYKNVLKDHIL